MSPQPSKSEPYLEQAATVLARAAGELRGTLVRLAAILRPFPAFLGMVSIQAVELDPPFSPREDRGCVVVTPDGEICELDLAIMPGISGIQETDQVEEFRELDLSDEEYILYAMTAIRQLAQELRRRGQ